MILSSVPQNGLHTLWSVPASSEVASYLWTALLDVLVYAKLHTLWGQLFPAGKSPSSGLLFFVACPCLFDFVMVLQESHKLATLVLIVPSQFLLVMLP